MKSLITITSKGVPYTIFDIGDEQDVEKRYVVGNGVGTTAPTDYHTARQQFVSLLDANDIALNQFGEPLELYNMELTTPVYVSNRRLH
jgi:hypothetical protein